MLTDIFRPFGAAERASASCPLYLDPVPAGFPSPAQDYVERRLDLHDHCVKRPASTFFVRAAGDSMIDAGIYPGDLLVVDRSLEPEHGDAVVAVHFGELMLKELALRPRPHLVARNSHYGAVEIPEGSDLEIWGVVTHVVRALRR